MTYEYKRDVVTYAGYELAVRHLRERGPMTTARLAKALGWARGKAADAIRDGRKYKLIRPDAGNRSFHGRRIYHAAEVPGWPLPAPDTLFPHERAPA